MFDHDNMLESIEKLPQQILTILDDKKFNRLHPGKIKIDNIIIAGMGSSLVGFKLLAALYGDNFTVPVFLVNKRKLPSWASKNTLVILSSYSGNSDETISCARMAIKEKCLIIGITGGGRLLNLLNNRNLFTYIIKPGLLNPCGQPRTGLGFSFGAFLKILQKLEVLQLKPNDIKFMIKTLQSINIVYWKNLAKKYANKINRKYVQIVSGGFLSGIAELFRKQLNWNAKQFASVALAPEAMHHLLEGVKIPTQKKDRLFVILNSSLLDKYDLSALKITRQYLQKIKLKFLEIDLTDRTKIEALFNCLLLVSFISFYLSRQNRFNPTPTPSIEYYKKMSKI